MRTYWTPDIKLCRPRMGTTVLDWVDDPIDPIPPIGGEESTKSFDPIAKPNVRAGRSIGTRVCHHRSSPRR